MELDRGPPRRRSRPERRSAFSPTRGSAGTGTVTRQRATSICTAAPILAGLAMSARLSSPAWIIARMSISVISRSTRAPCFLPPMAEAPTLPASLKPASTSFAGVDSGGAGGGRTGDVTAAVSCSAGASVGGESTLNCRSSAPARIWFRRRTWVRSWANCVCRRSRRLASRIALFNLSSGPRVSCGPVSLPSLRRDPSSSDIGAPWLRRPSVRELVRAG